MTNNWLEITVRFVVREHGIHDFKDAVSRDIFKAFDTTEIRIVTTTYNVVGFPPLQIGNNLGSIKENSQH